jgi:WD40 repeat protein
VAFTPDSQFALTAGFDNTIRLWDVASTRQRGSTLHLRKTARALAFDPTGKTVIICDDGDQTAKLWEVNTDSPDRLRLEHLPAVRIATFRCDGELVFTVSDAGSRSNLTPIRNGVARLWNARSGVPLGKDLNGISAADLSPDAKILLTGNDHGAIRFWDAAIAEPLGPPALGVGPTPPLVVGGVCLRPPLSLFALLAGCLHPVRGVFSSPDGRVAAIVGENQAQLWDAKTRKPLGQPLRHSKTIYAVAFNQAGTLLLTGSLDRTAQLWDVPSGNCLGPPLLHPDTVTSAAFSPDRQHFVTGCYSGGARLWDINDLSEPVILLDQGEVWAVAFSPDGQFILAGSSDGTARLWQANTGRPIGPPLQHGGDVNHVAFSPDSRFAATASSDWTARVWDVATGKPIGPPLQHERAVTQVAFSPDGQSVLTGSDDGTARVWNIRPPLQMAPERLTLWLSVITGLEMDDSGTVRGLDEPAWQQRRQRWDKETVKDE